MFFFMNVSTAMSNQLVINPFFSEMQMQQSVFSILKLCSDTPHVNSQNAWYQRTGVV